MNRTQILEIAATSYYTNKDITIREAIKNTNSIMIWVISAQRELNIILGAKS